MHFLKIPVFWGWILRILWSEVMNNYGVSEIHVFLHVETFELMLWVSFLAAVLNWNRCAEFCSLLLLERCKICVKNIHNLHILGNFEVRC